MVTTSIIMLVICIISSVFEEVYSPRSTQEQKTCIGHILMTFGWPLEQRYTQKDLIPKKAFKLNSLNCFDPGFAKDYFMHIADNISFNGNMKSPEDHCKDAVKATGLPKRLLTEQCNRVIKSFFPDCETNMDIIKYIFFNHVENNFSNLPKDNYAYTYYFSVCKPSIEFDYEKIDMPTEFCQKVVGKQNKSKNQDIQSPSKRSKIASTSGKDSETAYFFT